jgi:hypothetical protein
MMADLFGMLHMLTGPEIRGQRSEIRDQWAGFIQK